jgi:hypothetical protein
MVTIELQVDEETLVRARSAARARRQTLEQIVTRVVEELGNSPSAPQGRESRSIIGLFSDIPEEMDQIVEEAMALRKQRWQLRDAE